MSKIGFIYILTNDYMPDVYKVGCTERSPHERAAELSASTGVPAPFNVLCYMECNDFQAVEKRFHEWLYEFRISNGREFFCGGLQFAIRLLYWYRGRLSFTAPTKSHRLTQFELLCEHLDCPDGVSEMSETQDPWEKPAAAPAMDASVVAVVAAAASAAAVAQEGASSGVERP